MQHYNFNIMNRRSFLSTAGKAGIAAALASITDIPFVLKHALAEGTIGQGKKVLFIWLRGANDALNSVIPIMDPSYVSLTPGASYGTSTIRPTLVIPPDQATTYDAAGACDFPQAGGASTYGSYPYAIRLGNGFAALHPSLKFLAPVYNAGDLALIHRVGYPRQSRSHFDSQNYWENGSPNNNLVKDGIFYRAIIESGLAGNGVTGVSIQSSLPLILRGSGAAMTNLTDPLRYNLLSIPSPTGDPKSDAAIAAGNASPFAPKLSRDLLYSQYANLQSTLNAFANINFTEGGNTFRDDVVTDGDSSWATAHNGGYYLFPTSNDKNGGWRRTPGGATDGNKYVVNPNHQGFFYNLKAAALVLAQTSAIIAGTEIGGFDTHQTQGQLTGSHPDLQRAIGWALYGLRKFFMRYGKGGSDELPGATVSWNDVVVVTLTEFGRTTVENSDRGTDHAEAGVMFVAGGAVRGLGKGNASGVFNCHPSFDPYPWVPGPANQGGSTDGTMFGVSDRYLKRNTDFRSVLGEIIRKHLGATQSQLNRIIPGYANPADRLLAGGTSTDGTDIRGEVGFL
jgi:uncharacterized protein (DUF1501 family)